MLMKSFAKTMSALAALAFAACTSCDSTEPSGGNEGTSLPEEYTTEVEYYNFDPTVKESSIYAVKAAGEYIKVLPTTEPHMAWLGVDEGKAKFEISLQGEKIESVVVRPVAKNYDYRIEDGKIIIGLGKYDRVSVEVNGNIKNPLFIFVNPIDRERPSKDDPSVKYFEAGKIYDAGDIVLSEDCKEVYLEPGTYVKGNILGVDIEGVKIHGGGFLETTETNVGRYSEFYQPFSIALNRCHNSTLEDYTHLFAAGGWCSLFTNCDGSNIVNVHTIGTEKSPGVKTNNDSMDIIGGKNVHVKHTFLRGHDDCYCLKSQKFKLKGEVDGIFYEDCIGWNLEAGNTFEIGYETNMDINNVQYKDVYAIHSGTSGTNMRRAAFSIHNGARGTISNVKYENAYAEDVMEFAVYLAVLSHSYNIGYDDEGNELEYAPGQIKGVTYDNLNVLAVRDGKGYCVIDGYDDGHTVSDVTFNGFNYLGRKVTSLDDSIWSIKEYHSDITFN